MGENILQLAGSLAGGSRGGRGVKIGLVSEVFRDGDLEFNANQIKKRLLKCSQLGFNLVCFGEAFLQGFEALNWDYNIDSKLAVSQTDEIINSLRKTAKKEQIALSFGYFEKANNAIYCSNLFISSTGEILNNFRRLSQGWKVAEAGCSYKEGKGFSVFNYWGKDFATAICGDLWQAKNLRLAEELAIDCLLWPNYVDYSNEKWKAEKGEYARQVQPISAPVLLINSYVEQTDRAKGGCCVFKNGEVVKELPSGEVGVLAYHL